MTDVSEAIKPKSDQLNAEDLLGTTITAQITKVEVKTGDQPISVWLTGHKRPWKPCKSMGRVMAFAWGRNSKDWEGKSVTLYCDPDVTWAGVKVGGIRISHLSDIPSTMDMSLTASRGKRKPYRVDKLQLAEQKPSAYPDAEFKEKLPAILETIASGKMTIEQAIARLEKTGKLTDAQKAQLQPNEEEF
jgi:hypothetical protein